MTGIQKQYAGCSQREIHQAVCALSNQIVEQRSKKGWFAQAQLQHLRKERAALQQLLEKPRIVWVRV